MGSIISEQYIHISAPADELNNKNKALTAIYIFILTINERWLFMRSVQSSRCSECETWCQGFESDYGLLCADCFKKRYGIWP